LPRALQAAQAAKSLPPAALAQQPDWLTLMPDIEATGDVRVVRDVYGTRFGVLMDERDQGALLDDYFRGPRRIQDITQKLGAAAAG
jgi:hypothetical protein